MTREIAEIGAFEAKTKLSALLMQVEKGKSFYITKPVSRKRPLAKFGRGKGTVLYLAPDFDTPLDCFKDYMK